MAVSNRKAPKLHDRRRQTYVWLICAAFVATPLFAGVTSAGADQISYEKAQAASIAANIATLNNQVAYYSEKYDQANLQLQGLNSQMQLAQSKIEQTHKNIAGLRAKLATEAITLYTRGGAFASVSDLLSGTSTDITLRQVYAGAVANSQQALITKFQAATQSLVAEQQTLNGERAQVNSAVARAAASRKSAQAAMNQSQGQLNSVNSTLAQLVQAAQAATALAQQQRIRQLVLQQQAQQQTQSNSNATPPPAVQTNVPVGAGAAAAVRVALSELGKPYEFGAAGPNAFDCSGLTEYVWAQAGVFLPHSAAAQYDSIPHVSISQLQPGDLIFYYTPIDHVAIYIGNGEVVDADNPSYPVAIRNVYWDGMPVGVGRP